MHKYKRMKVFGTSIFLLKPTEKKLEIIQIAETNERHIKKELANQLLSACRKSSPTAIFSDRYAPFPSRPCGAPGRETA